ncbi:MAG: hypothetical protein H6863_01150 [Rhodospirillales bacterium]|nr:hypothetical protein [Rhodospirillales bacterium]
MNPEVFTDEETYQKYTETRKFLDDLFSNMKNGMYDDLTDTESKELGNTIATHLDTFCGLSGPKETIQMLSKFYNGVYVDNQEIRNEYSPMSNVLFEQFEQYISFLLKSHNDPLRALDDVLELSDGKKSGVRYPRMTSKLYEIEQQLLPKVAEIIDTAINEQDTSVFFKLTELAHLDQAASDSYIRHKGELLTSVANMICGQFEKALEQWPAGTVSDIFSRMANDDPEEPTCWYIKQLASECMEELQTR